MKRAITVTVGYVVDSEIMTDQEWEELESKLNGRELEVSDLPGALGLSHTGFANLQTHIEALIIAE